MAWSPQQDAALLAVNNWLKRGEAQVFRLFGFAGTGKTTLAKEIAAGVAGQVLFGAFTGKAASVLRQKGCCEARTLHSLIYTLREELDGAPVFARNPDSDILEASLLIVDEVSMVDEWLGRDLLSFGTKVLVLGDPAQLPPVNGEGFFDGEPDVMLTEVHRQAADNPIIRLSMLVRRGERLDPGCYGQSEVLSPGTGIDADRVLAADQVLVGRNVTRRRSNARFRELRGFGTALPLRGEKLVCLKNDRNKGLLNGGIWSVDQVTKAGPSGVHMKVVPETGIGVANIKVPSEFFTGKEDDLDWKVKKYSDNFTYGYALTVHKAQGSQWDDVVLFDESQYFREHRARHLYTGLTRAAKKVTVVL